VAPVNPAAFAQSAAAAQIERRGDRTFMDGEDVEDQIRDATVTAAVSAVSAHPEVRAVLRRRQRDAVPPGGAVVDGRDAGTAVVLAAMATAAGAKALDAADRIGSLEEGKYADMILIDTRRPHAVPMFDPATHLVYSTAKSDVRHVFVGGKQVVREGTLTRHDIGETLAAVDRLQPKIAASIA
jgi:hypothetical protein